MTPRTSPLHRRRLSITLLAVDFNNCTDLYNEPRALGVELAVRLYQCRL